MFSLHVFTVTNSMDNPLRLLPSRWSTYILRNCRYFVRINVKHVLHYKCGYCSFHAQTKVGRLSPVRPPGVSRGVNSLYNQGGHAQPKRAIEVDVSHSTGEAEFCSNRFWSISQLKSILEIF